MVINLDLKDRKILEQLEIDSRQSNSKIAKKVGLSKDAVAYRIKNLENKKLVLGYYSVLNITKLGYQSYKLMITLQDTNSKIEEEIISYLKKERLIGWIVSCDGYYNLLMVVWVKNYFEFEEFLKKFLKKYSKFIKERDILILTENHASRKRYLFPKKENVSDVYYSNEPKMNLDEKDLKIITFLANDARKPLYEIGDSLRLTPEAVSNRIKRLRKDNVIQAFRPIIDTSLLGYQYYNILFRLKKFSNIEKIFSYFRQNPNIIYFVKYIGEFDLGIDLEVENTEKLRQTLQEIKDLFYTDVESYSSVLISKMHKISYYPEL